MPLPRRLDPNSPDFVPLDTSVQPRIPPDQNDPMSFMAPEDRATLLKAIVGDARPYDQRLKGAYEALDKSGMVPKFPGIDTAGSALPPDAATAGKVLAPAAIDPGVMRDAAERLSRARIIQGITSTPTPTPYSMKFGPAARQVVDSPMWQGVREQATLPLQMEQARVDQQNKARDTFNKFLVEQARFGAEGRKMASTHVENEENRGARILGTYAALGGRFENAKKLKDYGHDLKTQDKIVEETGVKPGDMPNEGVSRLYSNLAAGQRAVGDMKKLLGEHPELTGPEGLHAAWGQIRLATPEGQRFGSLNQWIHEQVLQEAKRQGTKMGGSLAQTLLPHVGDNVDVANMGLEDLSGYMNQLTGILEGAHPKFDFKAGKVKPNFTITPFTDAQKAKGGGAASQPSGEDAAALKWLEKNAQSPAAEKVRAKLKAKGLL